MTDISEVKDNVESHGTSGDSVFIMCPNYEERSILSVRKLSPKYSSQLYAICRVAEYLDKGKSPSYYQEALRLLRRHVPGELTQIVFKMDDPVAFVRQLTDELTAKGKYPPSGSVTLDITTFPRQQLLLLLRFLDNSPHRGQIRLLYSEPASYATEAQSDEDRWLTRGVTSVHSVPGFSGIQYPRLGKLLVVIQGHEGERTHIALRRHQPDRVIFVGQSKDQFHSGLQEIAEAQNQDMLSIYGHHCLWPERIPARGIAETAHEIQRIYAEFRHDYNLFIAPFGSKFQLLGAYLAAREIPELQIIDASAAVYNWDYYSQGTKRMWETELEPLKSSLDI